MGRGTLKHIYEHSEERCIVYFDFLGFTEIVEKNLLFDVEMAFRKVTEDANSVLQNSRRVAFDGKVLEPVKGYFWFSDTLILYSRDSDPLNLKNLIPTAAYLLSSFLNDGIPTRCVITIGQFKVTKDNSNQDFFFGKGLINAFRLEKQMEWCGGILDDAIIDRSGVKDILLYHEGEKTILKYDVPLKGGTSKEFYSLGWPYWYQANFKKDSSIVRDDMQKKIGVSQDASVEAKIGNSIKYCNDYLRRCHN